MEKEVIRKSFLKVEKMEFFDNNDEERVRVCSRAIIIALDFALILDSVSVRAKLLGEAARV